MNRVRVLLGLLALFFCSDAFGAWPGECWVIFYSVGETFVSTSDTWAKSAPSLNLSTGNIAFGSSVQRSAGLNVAPMHIYLVYWSGTSWVISSDIYYGSVWVDEVSLFLNSNNGIKFTGTADSANWITYKADCSVPICDNADDDGDGICNSCDMLPGAPDKKHCIWTQSVTASDQVVSMAIDQSGNCDGSQLAYFTNNSLAGQKTYWDIGSQSEEINAPSCQGDDGTGNCKCGYPTSNEIFANMTEDPDTALAAETINQIQEQKENKEDPDYDDCSKIKARCEAACLSRGGVKTNTCSVSGDTTYAECQCVNEYAFNVATDADTSGNESTENGAVTETGGTDTNNDGTSDVYAAVKGAINDSGIKGKIDSTNQHLNSVGNKIDSLGSSIDGVGNKVDGLGSKVDGLGSKIDGVGSAVNSVGQSLGDKLDGIADKLGDQSSGDITATGDSVLPENNVYDPVVAEVLEEVKLSDAITEFISSGLPVVDYFRGTYINIGSTNPSMSTQIMGKTITIDFSGMESVLNNMGLVLVMVSTVLAFMIIVHKG